MLLTFLAPDEPVGLSVDDPALVHSLGRLFPHSANGDAPPTKNPSTIAVRSTPSGFAIESPAGRVTCASFSELLQSVEFVLSEAVLARTTAFVRLHAAGARIRDKAVLALGAGGAGKSTLAYAWQRAGLAAYGDDLVLIDRDGVVHAFPRLFKLDTRVLERLGSDPAETPFWEPGNAEAWFDPAESAGWAAPAIPCVVAIVRYRTGAAFRCSPLSRHELLSALLVSRIRPTRAHTEDVQALSAVVRAAVGLDVEFGDPHEAAERLAMETE